MSYQLRMHNEIRDWLTDLRAADPQLSRLVGEAIVALLEAGEDLGTPLVVLLESALRAPEDPREVLDYTYQRQLEALQKVRRGVADVASASNCSSFSWSRAPPSSISGGKTRLSPGKRPRPARSEPARLGSKSSFPPCVSSFPSSRAKSRS